MLISVMYSNIIYLLILQTVIQFISALITEADVHG
jgi:hypothetical protein